MPLLKPLNQNPETGFQLIPKTNHTTPQNGPLIMIINGEIYDVIFEENCFSSTSQLSPASIQVLFDNGKLYRIRCRGRWTFNMKSSQVKQFLYFICFHDIPQRGPIKGHISPIGPIQFSILHFSPKFFCVRLGIPYDNTTPNFGIGCLKVEVVIDMFKERIQSKISKINIQQLWFEFINFLYMIGYFNIFDYNNFLSFSFIFFLKMFPPGNHVRKENRITVFYSFIEYLMMGNRCFIIHGQNIRPVRGKLYSGLIELFFKQNDPIVNFVDNKAQYVGITLSECSSFIEKLGEIPTCHIVFLETMEVRNVGPLFDVNTITDRIQEKITKNISEQEPDSDFDDEPSLLERRPTIGNDTRLIQNGSFEIHGFRFIIFKTLKLNHTNIQCFLQTGNRTFEVFTCFFLTLLFMFSPDNRFFQLDEHFDGSIDGLVDALVICGFEPIFDKTETPKELHHFLIESNFGILLQILRCEYETHKSAICAGSRDSIREIKYFKSFTRVLQMICNLLREKKNSELSPEIYGLLEFMEVLIQL